jgi:hypothetical protein
MAYNFKSGVISQIQLNAETITFLKQGGEGEGIKALCSDRFFCGIA